MTPIRPQQLPMAPVVGAVPLAGAVGAVAVPAGASEHCVEAAEPENAKCQDRILLEYP